MGLLDRLFSRRREPAQTSSGVGYHVATSEEVNRNAEEMGEMYYDCPKCQKAERINNMGKMVLKSNPAFFSSMKCTKCGHTFDAGRRVKFGKAPGSDSAQA